MLCWLNSVCIQKHECYMYKPPHRALHAWSNFIQCILGTDHFVPIKDYRFVDYGFATFKSSYTRSIGWKAGQLLPLQTFVFVLNNRYNSHLDLYSEHARIMIPNAVSITMWTPLEISIFYPFPSVLNSFMWFNIYYHLLWHVLKHIIQVLISN